MPQVRKEALSQFIHTECLRQLRLNLSPENEEFRAERNAAVMPPKQPQRPGMDQLARSGEEWQAEKLVDLSDTFGSDCVIGDRYTNRAGKERFRNVNLRTLLDQLPLPGCFLVEAEFGITQPFEDALELGDFRQQYGLSYTNLRPDIIELLPADDTNINRYIAPNGSAHWLEDDDNRQQLRIIDIKLTAELSPSYFAEVTYYSMVLAGWLIDQGLHDKYVVVPNAAIWPGSHDVSVLVQKCREIKSEGGVPCYSDLWQAMQKDLEEVPFDAFVGKVRHFLTKDVPYVLEKNWDQLPLHVDDRCKGCDYLGYPWLDRERNPTWHDLHCIPTAKRTEHISRVAFISRGASIALSEEGVSNTADLAQLQPSASVFDSHYSLRATRNVVSGRAGALQSNRATIPNNAGTSCMMPKWADLHVYIAVNFDSGSAISFALGAHAFWMEPQPYGYTGQRNTHLYSPTSHIIDQKDLNVERREILAFLNDINTILADAKQRNADTTVQFYIWDLVQYEHLTRIIGRHLQAVLADNTVQHLAWLFPPEELLPNPTMETRRSPITIVREVIKTHLAAPIPHYYNLFQTAKVYHRPSQAQYMQSFSVHPLFEDALSDQIPSERAHEIWARVTRPRLWSDQLKTLQETVAKQLQALEAVTRRLELDLQSLLSQAAPKINIQPPQRQSGISFDGQLWYVFAKLDAVLRELEVHQIRAMSPEEREARYKSARLTRRLTGLEEQSALQKLGISSGVGLRIYEMRQASKEVKLREGDFTFALAPESIPGFLDRTVWQVTQGTSLEPAEFVEGKKLMDDVTSVSVVAINRDDRLIALRPSNFYPTMLDDLEREELADFSQNVVLDPRWIDTFTKKLEKTLHSIGNPPQARDNPIVRRAVGLTNHRRGRVTANSPVADALWSANVLSSSTVSRATANIRTGLEQDGVSLNSSQWDAWEQALTRRLCLIWGPPGTGKSRTLKAIASGAVMDAVSDSNHLRMLICAPTYRALDNVLLDVAQDLQAQYTEADIQTRRLRSSYHPLENHVPRAMDLEINRRYPSPNLQMIKHRLQNSNGITIIGATTEQTHNLLLSCNGAARQELFDVIIMDEASQVDVGHAILPFASLADNGALVIAGDPKQLPPIHKAKAPEGLEAMVGSIYEYFAEIHSVAPSMLTENYRSNSTIVELAHEAGYDRSLSSFSPNMRVHYLSDIAAGATLPTNWPKNYYWTPEWASLLSANTPLCCFIYPEGRSSQWNPFEADAIVSIISALAGRMSSRLQNEKAIDGSIQAVSNTPYSDAEFWKKGIGIVTPHRAQQALIISKLQHVFGPQGISTQLIRDAVDTVERFQGQQRDVIIASFALGDQDAISDEDEFLMNLNRFNVMASRARAKLITFISQEVVNHLSNDLKVLRESRLIKVFAETFCDQGRPMTLGYYSNGQLVEVEGIFKYRE